MSCGLVDALNACPFSLVWLSCTYFRFLPPCRWLRDGDMRRGNDGFQTFTPGTLHMWSRCCSKYSFSSNHHELVPPWTRRTCQLPTLVYTTAAIHVGQSRDVCRPPIAKLPSAPRPSYRLTRLFPYPTESRCSITKPHLSVRSRIVAPPELSGIRSIQELAVDHIASITLPPPPCACPKRSSHTTTDLPAPHLH